MAKKAVKAYPLRIHADILDAMKRWSDDELQIPKWTNRVCDAGCFAPLGPFKRTPP